MKNHPRKRPSSRKRRIRRVTAGPTLEQLQATVFELIPQVLNIDRPASLSPIEPTDGPDDTSWCADSQMFAVSQAPSMVRKAGVLLAIIRFAMRALEVEEEGVRILAPQERTWPCVASPANRDISRIRDHLRTLCVGTALPLQLVNPRGRKLPSLKSPAARFLVSKYQLIELYRSDAGRFVDEQLYTLPEDAMEELRTEDPALAPWWSRWMSQARQLPPLTPQSARRWFAVIWVLIQDEYRGAPEGLDPNLQKAPRPVQHPFFENQISLVPLGHTAAAKRRADYLRDHLPVGRCPSEIAARIRARGERVYRRHLPIAIKARLREVWLRLIA